MTYRVSIDLNNENNSHTQIINRIPKYANVLELGCAHGDMSNAMKIHKQARVIGIEQDAVAAYDAGQVCDYVFQEDLDDKHSLDMVEYEYFDVITLVDVLEHVKQPLALLKRLKARLIDEDGVLLLSVPNVAHASIRLELLNGSFTPEETGILDKTHLHYFTVQTIQELLIQAGYVIDELEYTWHDLPDEVIGEYLERAGLIATPEALQSFHTPESIAYQFIITARPATTEMHDKAVTSQLKPLRDSWEVWAKLHGKLQQTEQELETIKNTRSWKLVRNAAEVIRKVKPAI